MVSDCAMSPLAIRATATVGASDVPGAAFVCEQPAPAGATAASARAARNHDLVIGNSLPGLEGLRWRISVSGTAERPLDRARRGRRRPAPTAPRVAAARTAVRW